MNFGQAVQAGFANYVNFSSRASRSEYWYWVLFVVIVAIATSMVDAVMFGDYEYGLLNALWSLATFIPGISIAVRRLHDIDRTGWWILIGLTVIGLILLLVWACMKGTEGPNRFGPDPLA